MYKRHMLGEQVVGLDMGGIVNFLIFITLVIWLLPMVVEYASGMALSDFMIPPVWRGDIFCDDGNTVKGSGDVYVYEGGVCYKIPAGNLAQKHEVAKQDDTTINARIVEAQGSFGIKGIFDMLMLGLRYGILVVTLASVVVMRVKTACITDRPAWSWLAAPLVALAVFLGAYDVQGAVPPWALIAPVWGSMVAADMWSTLRFGRNILGRETNPLLSWSMSRLGIGRAIVLHLYMYAMLMLVVPHAMEYAGSIYDAERSTGILMAALAGAHLWCTGVNVQGYRCLGK